jgi:hypothetical protein
MNDADKDPSPTNRRRVFGIRNANIKQSAVKEVPNRRVIRWSRKYPQIRLITVATVIMEADLRICRFSVNPRLPRANPFSNNNLTPI